MFCTSLHSGTTTCKSGTDLKQSCIYTAHRKYLWCLTVFIMIGPVYTLFLIHTEKFRRTLAHVHVSAKGR